MNGIKTIKKITTSAGNKIEFYATDLIAEDHVIVLDKSCQMERTYIMGLTILKDIESDTSCICESIEQVIEFWTKEQIWF